MIELKDPLEYTVEELQALSIDELTILLRSAEMMESQFNTRQLVEKTMINSLYGALANKYFPLLNEDMAAAITGNGRYFIRKLANNIDQTLQQMLPSEKPYVIYGDTDSNYVQIEPFVNMYMEKNPYLGINEYVDWADAFEKKVIQPIIASTIEEFSTELNAYNKKVIGAAREVIADTAVFTAKKKYYARVRDSEGIRYPADEPYIKVMGLELIKSSTPTWSKKYLKEAIPHILDKDEGDLRDWIKSIKQEFITVDVNAIAGSGGITSLDYNLKDKGVPIGSRSAIRYNNYVKENKLDDVYQLIQPGDKCKRIFLVQPNKFHTEIISYNNDAFAQELVGLIDYDTNFKKNFLKPLEIMTAPLNYNLEKETAALDDW